MNFELTMEEMKAVIDLLNETPTKMGFFPICQKLIAQFNAVAESAAKPAEAVKPATE